jgi:hypothetical protein
MLYTPVPGTPLYAQMQTEDRMLTGVDYADIHGQFKFNFKHAAISRDDSKRFLDWAFRRDFERNGPSIYRICETMLRGWQRYKDSSDIRVRTRFANEILSLKTAYNAALWAMETHYRSTNQELSRQIRTLRKEIEREFGVGTRALRAILGPVMLWSSRREDRRLASGQTYEPPTIIERRNWAPA